MHQSIGSLSKGVFERRTSTGSEVFFILKHLDAPKFVFLSVLTIIETSCPKRWAKPPSKNEKRPLLVYVRRSKTSLLKFTNSRLRPAPPSPGISVFFALDGKFPGMETIRRSGEEKRGQTPRPPKTLQHFSMIAQSNSAVFSTLMCNFLFQLRSSFV